MAEASQALQLLRQERVVAEEVVSVLQRCPRGTRLDAISRGVIRDTLVHLQDKDKSLEEIVCTLEQHQQRRLEVESLRAQVRAGEERIREYARQMSKAVAALADPLKEARKILDAGARAEKAKVDIGDIVAYAQRISGTTSAPSYWRPGMAMVGFAPPAPRAEMMRGGALSLFAVATEALREKDLAEVARALDQPPPEQPEGDQGHDGGTGAARGGENQASAAATKQQQEPTTVAGEAKDTDSRRQDPNSQSVAANKKLGQPDGSPAAVGVRAKRPKISLDLDDLESSASDDSEDEK